MPAPLRWCAALVGALAACAARAHAQADDGANQALNYDSGTGFTLDWDVDTAAGVITFTAVAQTTGYISVGFTNGGPFHGGGDCFTAWVANGQVIALDGYSDSTSQPVTDANNDYTVVSGTEANGQTTIVFSRPIALNGADDYLIEDKICTVYWTVVDQDGTGDTYPYHGGGNYASFTANLLDANAVIGNASKPIDPGFGLTLSILGPFVLYTLYSLYRDYDKGTLREYAVSVPESQTPVGKWATGVANRVSMAFGFRGGGNGMYNGQIAPNGLPMPPGGGGMGGMGGGFGRRMSQALGQVRQRIVRTNIAPKSTEPSGPMHEFKKWGRQRLNNEMTYMQALLMALYVVIAVAWVYLPTYKSPADAWGFVCCASALLVVVPATRNSLLTWFLFAPFERTILYHRYLGRFTFLAGLLHTLYYVLQWIQDGTLSVQLARPEIRDGVISMAGLTAIFLTSFDKIRRSYYQFFRILHYSFFLFYIFGVRHKAVFLYYTVISLVLYATDILMRYSLDLFPKEAYAMDILPGEVIRIRFPKSKFKSYEAGQYVFLNFPSLALGEWHPFTLSSGPYQDYLEVHIKALGDFTRQLLDQGGKVINGQAAKFPKVRVDGPYGHLSLNLNRYENVLLVSGGVGVTPMVSCLREIYQLGMSEEAKRKRPISPHLKNVYFLWVIRDTAPWAWFFDVLKEAMAVAVNGASRGYPKLRVKGYVTKPDENTASLVDAVSNIPNYSVSLGRPNIPMILQGVESSIDASKNSNGGKRIATCLCGPSKLVGSVWDGCVARSVGNVHYDLHKEEFDF